MILLLLGEVSQSHFQVLTYFLICLTYPLTGLPAICEGKTELSYYINRYSTVKVIKSGCCFL